MVFYEDLGSFDATEPIFVKDNGILPTRAQSIQVCKFVPTSVSECLATLTKHDYQGSSPFKGWNAQNTLIKVSFSVSGTFL